jgi:Domain of unknown function (DU1801)
MAAQATGTLEELLVQLTPEVAVLVTAVDELVHRTDPDVVRVVWPHQRTMGYGVGPKKMSEHYAYVTVHANHVNLGCNYGARLDSGGLLEGTGASMRKTTVRSTDVLDDPRLVPLLRAARRERLQALGRA